MTMLAPTSPLSLPRDILVDSVLSLLDHRSLIFLSRSSKECRRIAFEEVRWEAIDLRGSGISDRQLRALLTIVGARERTRVLCLAGCANVRGVGLEPLGGSKVLEDVDLRVRGTRPLRGELGRRHGESGLDEGLVTRLLLSMLPTKVPRCVGDDDGEAGRASLRRVAIRPPRWTPSSAGSVADYDPPLRRFFERFEALPPPSRSAAKISSFQNQRCSLCFVETLESDGVSCPICDGRYCRACALPSPPCAECSRVTCQWCDNSVKCASCSVRGCPSHGYECCGGCDAAFCVQCRDDELEFCLVCNEFYCSTRCHEGVHGGSQL